MYNAISVNGGTYYIYKVIGICSLCGGEVKVYAGAWFGVYPPTPQCVRCGAVPKTANQTLPTIEMEPVKLFVTGTTTVRSSTTESTPLKREDDGASPSEPTNSDQIRCPYCNGTGLDSINKRSNKNCRGCGGSGTIPALLCNDCNHSILNCKC